MDADEWEAMMERATGVKKYYMVHTFDGTYNIVQGHPTYNPPAVKTGLTREEAEAFMKLLK